ncbi:AAA family ATPase [Rhizobium leguminosarum]|uniref:TniB family NTP-binding protein n=1 Tax=Rhizobium leguminosarum TaxID=384 RepID=UPI001C915CF1|nr:TniB family NTP-binding protein [Rhizobium leguminosarum]MBY3029455.1 AAA family ATPase [Rhizobium leguminosarum]
MFPRFNVTALETAAQRAEAASRTPEERQAMVRDVLFKSADFTARVKDVQRFHMPVDGGAPDVGQVGALLGDFRSGKSFVLQYFASKHPPVLTEAGYQYPVLYIEARRDWNSMSFGREIFDGTAAAAIPNLSVATINKMATTRLIKMGVKLLIVDDVHAILNDRGQRRSVAMSLVKYIADRRFCNVLLAGHSAIETAMTELPEIEGRGGLPRFRMRKYDQNSVDDRERLQYFLHGVDRLLPFRELSGLGENEYLADFFHISRGTIGWPMNVISAAAFLAINDGTPRITLEHLRHAAAERLSLDADYVPFGRGAAHA